MVAPLTIYCDSTGQHYLFVAILHVHILNMDIIQCIDVL